MNKEQIKKWFTATIIIILAVIIFLQRSCESNQIINPPTVVTSYDTIWKIKHDTLTKYVTIASTFHPTPPSAPQYQPSNNIDTCNIRFNKLLKDFITTRVYKDTLKLDSLGTIIINDTVFMNQLGKRTKIYDYKIPLVTKTVTITKHDDPRRQLYIGGNIFGNDTHIEMVTPGILYKSKQDNIYQINLGIGFDGAINYGLGMYYKIKLK